MNLALGTKAKLAITSSLGKLNQKLRHSSFTSPGTYSGVIQNQSAWSASEQSVWVVVLMMGVGLLYGNRIGLPLALSKLAIHENWDLNFQVWLIECLFVVGGHSHSHVQLILEASLQKCMKSCPLQTLHAIVVLLVEVVFGIFFSVLSRRVGIISQVRFGGIAGIKLTDSVCH